MFIIDSENKINNYNSAPDKLRAELGLYYIERDGNLEVESFSSSKIQDYVYDHSVEQNIAKLKPFKTSRIFLKGAESEFRNQHQWDEYIQESITPNVFRFDHKTTITPQEVSRDEIIKNFHHPYYEDQTKLFPTKQLLNYNLNKYPFLNNSPVETRNIADMRTQFDLIDPEVSKILNEFGGRINQYTGSLQSLSDKQRNIFLLFSDDTDRVGNEDFPYYLAIDFNESANFDSGFNEILKNRNKIKNLFKNINSPSSFFLYDFYVDNAFTTVKIYDIFDLTTKKSISEFQEGVTETFLLEQQDMNDLENNSFIEGIDALHFLSEMRSILKNKLRNIEDVFQGQDYENFLVGYKIEKYIDNDVTSPIQTYYTINDKFTDTQLKYNRKYIYKIKALIAVMGVAYKYKNINSSAAPIEIDDFESINPYASEKFWCSIDVDVEPSFKMIELDLGTTEECFIDSPSQSPYVEIFSRKNESMINFLLRPRGFETTFPESLSVGETYSNVNLVSLKEEDAEINKNALISNTSYGKQEYFTGIYQVFMTEEKPIDISDFRGKFLISVDEKTGLTYPQGYTGDQLQYDNLNAIFSQKVVPNKKYYYLFRAVTYNGTPSEPSEIYEVELKKDSDEYRVDFKEISLEYDPSIMHSKNIKRIISIEPNYERLIMSDASQILDNEIDNASLSTMIDGAEAKVFKLRITSKHTGKKVDINLRFKIVKDGTFTN